MDYPRVFIGYDARETVAYHVASHSILKHSSVPISITPLVRSQLPVDPERDAKASTDFADTRFLVPWLCGFEGWAVFIDCDELFTVDPMILWNMRDDRYSVMVRKHNHNPENERKFLNQPQRRYEKKNWSSLMLFNCAKCRELTPEYVRTTPGLDLHQFKWTDERLIGELPRGWNFLVNHDYFEGVPPLIHWTDGTPCFHEYQYAPYSELWWQTYKEMVHCEQT